MSIAVTDLAELSATVPPALDAFAAELQREVESGSFREVAGIRGKAREITPEDKIDHVDLVDLSWRSDMEGGRKLAEAMLGAIKYNRVSKCTSAYYGLAAWFPNENLARVDKWTKMHQDMGFSQEYTDCMRRYAQVKVMTYLLIQSGKGTLTLTDAKEWMKKIQSHSFSDRELIFLEDLGIKEDKKEFLAMEGLSFSAFHKYIKKDSIKLKNLVPDPKHNYGVYISPIQWEIVSKIQRHMILDERETGQLEMGTLQEGIAPDSEGYLVPDLETKWVTLEGKSIAFYQTSEAVEGESGTLLPGYIPVRINGREARLGAQFDKNSGLGKITGISLMNENEEITMQRETPFELKKGDIVEFYGNFKDGNGEEYNRTLWFYTAPSDTREPLEIEYKEIRDPRMRVYYELTTIDGSTYLIDYPASGAAGDSSLQDIVPV